MGKNKWAILFVGWTALILWLSMKSELPDLEVQGLSWDKLHHALAYGVMTFFAGMALRSRLNSVFRAWNAAFLMTVLIGAFVEVAQGALTEVRAAEWGDLLANTMGAAMVLVLARMMERGRARPCAERR